MSKKRETVVIENPILPDDNLIKGHDCQICCEDLNLDNYIAYRLSETEPWSLVTTMCSDCLDALYSSQNEKVKHFVQHLSCLNECSKLLKSLLRGEYGIPVNIHDVVIFASVGNRAIPNNLDPEFGRKSEVYRLSIGQRGESRDPHLSNAPSTREEVREVLARVVEKVQTKLRDYDSTQIEAQAQEQDDTDRENIREIIQNLNVLTERLTHGYSK